MKNTMCLLSSFFHPEWNPCKRAKNRHGDGHRQDNTHSSVSRPKQRLPQIGLAAAAVNVSHAALRVIALLSPFNQLNFVQILRYFTSFFSFFFLCQSFFFFSG